MADRSRAHQRLAVLAATLGALALAAGDPYPAGRRPGAAGDASFVTAVDVARWIRNAQPDLRLVDLRADSLFDAYHVPGAERIAPDELRRLAWPGDETIVLYAADDAEAIRGAVVLRRRGVPRARVLRGGVLSWVEEIVEPRLRVLPATATPAEQAARREQLELSRYFGGTPVVSPSADPLPNHRPQSEAAAVARVLRRGC